MSNSRAAVPSKNPQTSIVRGFSMIFRKSHFIMNASPFPNLLTERVYHNNCAVTRFSVIKFYVEQIKIC